MNKLSHHEIQIQLDVEMEQLLKKLTETTGLSTSELFKISLQYLIQENTHEKIRHKPIVDMLPDREDKLGSVAWVREWRAPLQKDPDSETSGETSNIKQVLALLNSPLFKNVPPGNPEAIESVIEANRTADETQLIQKPC